MKAKVTIYEAGAAHLIGLQMHTSKGLKTIRMIRPYRYKALTVHFSDGTHEERQFDEPFHVEAPKGILNRSY